jgi:hypothetical protein
MAQVFAFLLIKEIVKKLTNNLKRVVMIFESSTMDITYNETLNSPTNVNQNEIFLPCIKGLKS